MPIGTKGPLDKGYKCTSAFIPIMKFEVKFQEGNIHTPLYDCLTQPHKSSEIIILIKVLFSEIRGFEYFKVPNKRMGLNKRTGWNFSRR